MPAEPELTDRLRVVLQVLYLIFNEGYTASSGTVLARADLTREAIRLTRAVHALRPDDGEVAGLLALMMLTEARRPARTGSDGELVPLTEQDRARWDADAIRAGLALVAATLPHGPVGPYQVQAAIAAVHAEAPGAADTDWPQILSLYDLLSVLAPNPMVTLNRVVALAMVHGPAGRPRPVGVVGHRPAAGRAPPGRRRTGAPARHGRRSGSRTRGVPAGGPQDDQRSGAALPDRACGPPRSDVSDVPAAARSVARPAPDRHPTGARPARERRATGGPPWRER